MKSITLKIAALSLAMPLCTNAQTTDSIAKQLGEAIVTGTRSIAKKDANWLPYSITTINRAEIENSYEPSLLPVLNEQVPSLFITQRGIMGYGISTGAAGGMKMRGIGGSPTTQMLVLIDGHPQYAGLMGHPLADTYQSLLAQSVGVVRGPASVLYGSNAMGGIINIITRKRYDDGITNKIRLGAGSYGTFSGEYAGTAKRGKLSGVWAGSYNRTDGHRKNMEFDQATGFGKINYEINNNWNAEANANLTHFNSANPGTVAAPKIDNDMNITRGMASASIYNMYDKSNGGVTYFYNWGNHNINDGYTAPASPKEYRFISRDNMTGVNLFQTINFFGGNRTTFGFDYEHMFGKAYNKFNNGSRTMLADKQTDEFAGYADFSQELFGLLSLDAGVRYDYHSRAGSQWIPQGGVSLRLPRNAELKAAVSKGFRVPTIKDMYMFNSKNPDLDAESLVNYEISYSQNLMNGRLNYGINVFYLDADNLIETVAVDGRMINRNTGKLHNFGVEANAAFRVNPHLSINSNYSYLHTNKIVLSAPKNKFHAGADYSLKRWNFAGGIQHIGGLYKAKTGKNRSETYTLLDLRASFKVTSFFKVYAKGNNLLAQKYETYAGFPMPRTTFMAGADITF